MPLTEDSNISRESDGSFNEDYCKWCYTNGQFTYASKEALLDFLVDHMPNPEELSDEMRRSSYDAYLSTLKRWR